MRCSVYELLKYWVVELLMSIKWWLLSEFFRTMITLISLLSSVDDFMHPYCFPTSKRFPTEFAQVWFLTTMYAEMLYKIRLVPNTFPANITLVLLSCMNSPHVVSKRSLIRTQSWTLVALDGWWWGTPLQMVMSNFMFTQLILVRILVLTEITWEWSVPGMPWHVLFQISSIIKAFPTNFAYHRILFQVSLPVNKKSCFVNTRVVTEITIIRPLPSMGLEVVVQMDRSFEGAVAVDTRMRPLLCMHLCVGRENSLWCKCTFTTTLRALEWPLSSVLPPMNF